ncbi:MAG: hypothetical protein AAF215_19855 [Cyanobacteria bacterium P01_A01_bin.123]
MTQEKLLMKNTKPTPNQSDKSANNLLEKLSEADLSLIAGGKPKEDNQPIDEG